MISWPRASSSRARTSTSKALSVPRRDIRSASRSLTGVVIMGLASGMRNVGAQGLAPQRPVSFFQDLKHRQRKSIWPLRGIVQPELAMHARAVLISHGEAGTAILSGKGHALVGENCGNWGDRDLHSCHVLAAPTVHPVPVLVSATQPRRRHRPSELRHGGFWLHYSSRAWPRPYTP